MSVSYIRTFYNMPQLKRGLTVVYNNQRGKIISFPNAHISIRLDNEQKIRVHPKDDNLYINYD